LKEKQEKFDFTSIGKRVLTIESAAIARLKDQLDNNFDIACQLCLDCSGKIIVMGMGKSGHIADKLAATLASTGTPSFFVHPGEASHGDLGMISRSDVVIALSNSGKTEEIVSLLPILKNMEEMSPKRDKWIAAFFDRITTRGTNLDGDIRRVVAPEELPKKPRRKFRVTYEPKDLKGFDH